MKGHKNQYIYQFFSIQLKRVIWYNNQIMINKIKQLFFIFLILLSLNSFVKAEQQIEKIFNTLYKSILVGL